MEKQEGSTGRHMTWMHQQGVRSPRHNNQDFHPMNQIEKRKNGKLKRADRLTENACFSFTGGATAAPSLDDAIVRGFLTQIERACVGWQGRRELQERESARAISDHDRYQ